MKHLYFILFLISFSSFSQQKMMKTLDKNINEISVLAFELDYVEVVNSDSNLIEIELKDVNAKNYQIVVANTMSNYKISFKQAVLEDPKVFRKFITKRISKVNAVIKVPKNKTLTIFGKDIDIYSKSYDGDLKIYVDKGEIQLNKVKQNAEVRLFNGNVSAAVSKTNIDVASNNGTILVNDKVYKKKANLNQNGNKKDLIIKSINANIKLSSL